MVSSCLTCCFPLEWILCDSAGSTDYLVFNWSLPRLRDLIVTLIVTFVPAVIPPVWPMTAWFSFSHCILNSKLVFVELKDKQHQSGFLHSVSTPPPLSASCLINIFQFLLSAPSQKLFPLFSSLFPRNNVVFSCWANVFTNPTPCGFLFRMFYQQGYFLCNGCVLGDISLWILPP